MTQLADPRAKEMFAAAVCRLLRESRRRQKLTQAQVAAKTGGLISKAALANYETGHRSLRIDVLWVIANALGENIGTMMSSAERGLGRGADHDQAAPITIDLDQIRGTGDTRLGSVRRWVDLQGGAELYGNTGVMVLDIGAIAALASLMAVSAAECRQILMTVARRDDVQEAVLHA